MKKCGWKDAETIGGDHPEAVGVVKGGIDERNKIIKKAQDLISAFNFQSPSN